ncbi:MAG: hypothetical protein ACXWJM_01445 [Ramlibacter sp.]
MTRRLAWISLAGLAAVLIGGEAGARPPGTPLQFGQVFAAREQGPVHYRATFVSRGAEHGVEVWRDGATRLKRVTDAQVETFALREPGQAEFEMTVLDLRRKIETKIDRSNLYRIGNFTDWFDLAHALRHPAGTYALRQAAPPKGAPQAVEACRWYELEQQENSSLICWSARHELPLLIVSRPGEVVWRVTQLDRRSIPADVFTPRDEGFVRNDANQDIERD